MVVNNFRYGIHTLASNATVVSSYIGTDATGITEVGNAGGVFVESASAKIGGTTGTTPGGACTGDCNVLAGNFTNLDIQATGALVQGNFIGVQVTGTSAQQFWGGLKV